MKRVCDPIFQHCLDADKKVNKYRRLMEITTELEDGDADSEDNGDKQLTISGIQMLLERALSTYNSSVHKYKTLLHQEQEVRGKVLNVSTVELRWLEHLLGPWKFDGDTGSSSHYGQKQIAII